MSSDLGGLKFVGLIMSNKTSQTSTPPTLTKKHLAKLQREQMYRRYLIIGTVVVLVLVAGILLYGLVFQPIIKSNQAVAQVDSQKITMQEWQRRTRFQRANLLNSAENTYQFARSFSDPSFQSSFASQLQQIKLQLDAQTLGKDVLDSMVEDIVIQKQAEKLGVTVSQAEVQQNFDNVFGYYPNGTPTSKPTLAPMATSTLSLLQLTMIPPTATPLPTEVVTATQVLPTPTETAIPTATSLPTATSQPTATPKTVEGLDVYAQTIKSFDTNFGVNEQQFRSILFDVLKAQLYREKVQEAVLAQENVSRTEPQVWARHLLVADEQQAKDVYDRLQKGEDFCKLAAELSTDTSNKDQCGDLGWFGKGQMVQEFEDAAFALKVGGTSQPVKTSFGYHIIQSLGNEERPLTDSAYQSAQLSKFNEWLDARKAEHTITINEELWKANVVTEPAWPDAFDLFITQAQQQQVQPTAAPSSDATPAP